MNYFITDNHFFYLGNILFLIDALKSNNFKFSRDFCFFLLVSNCFNHLCFNDIDFRKMFKISIIYITESRHKKLSFSYNLSRHQCIKNLNFLNPDDDGDVVCTKSCIKFVTVI